MENHVPIESITVGQCAKFVDVLVATLRKSGLPSHPTQEILESQASTLANEFVASLRARVEAVSNMIVRRVRVNRSRTPEQVLEATGRKQYTNKSAVGSMPRGEGEEVEVYFFKLGRYISCADLEKEYELRGLKPDPYAQAMVNEVDPAFADDHPNGSQWKDADGNYAYVAFSCWRDGRRVDCYRNDSDWNDDWWFVGVRK